MHPDLAAKYPGISTYTIRGLDQPASVGRLDLSPAGLHAILRHPDGAALISPDFDAPPTAPKGAVISRRWQDSLGHDWECLVGPEHGAGPPAAIEQDYQPRGPLPLRTYRFAFACTGEFAAFHSALQGNPPNTADALAALVTITNRVNFIVEQDVAVRLTLVPNNDLLIFLDPETDPYDGVASNPNLAANRTACANIIGNANFDLGHVITMIPGGVAYLGAACGTNKAGGVSGIPRTVTPDYDYLGGEVVMHEVGHQLGANHTFNGSVDRCLANRNGSTAWEPGSGSTILGYAGGCPVGNDPPGDNLQVFRDIMYHHGSIGEMRNFLNSGNNACAGTLESGNSPPTFSSLPSNVTIPKLTPFELAGLAADPDGDTLTYSWEQRDTGPQQALTEPDNGTSPLFRTFLPTLSGSRLFPQLADCLSGVPDPTEELPSISPATRRFRLTVRDNHPGAGGVIITSNILLQVGSTGPFQITEPLAGQVFVPGVTSVRWDVAGTDAAPFNVATVAIDLSTDGGQTFPIVLVPNAPNTGVAQITLPTLWAGNARIRIRPNGHIFRAFSPPFSIQYCDGDVNCDGSANGLDVAVQEAAVGGDLADFCQPDPDFNHDGAVNGLDVEALELVIGGAPCP
ncbi:MAG: hypothetical protein HBSAPP03_26780 [Phycisphaerae bacterium]|nr:MAG: hypothetical protein HBSAPP03_26780 [Phycisphaerae bacterium]